MENKGHPNMRENLPTGRFITSFIHEEAYFSPGYIHNPPESFSQVDATLVSRYMARKTPAGLLLISAQLIERCIPVLDGY